MIIQNSRDTRALVLEQSLRKLGVERLSKDDVQKMQWEVLEAKIGNWIHYMRIAVRICVKFCFIDSVLVLFSNLIIMLDTGQTALRWGKENL